MDHVLLDTSVLVAALRRAESSTFSASLAGEAPWLSVVVLEELYAGSRTKDRRVLEGLEQAALAAGRLLVPTPANRSPVFFQSSGLAFRIRGNWTGASYK